MTANLTTVNAILKEIYGPRIEEQLQDEIVAKKRIERTSDGVVETVGGKYVDFPIRTTRNHGMGYRDEDEDIPDARKQGYEEVHVGLKYGYGRVRLTGQLMQLAEKNPQAFASAMDREMSGLKDDIAKDQNRICYGDGNGTLAIVNDTLNTNEEYTVVNAQYMEEDMYVDVVTIADGNDVASAADQVVLDVDTENNVVTTDTSFTPTDDGTQAFVRQNSWGKEPVGFDLIVDDTDELHGLNPSTVPQWAATVLDNSGTNRALSETLMITAVDKARVKGGKTSVFLTSLGVRRAYFNLLTQQRRYTDTKEFAGGFTGLVFNHGREIPVVEDVDAPPNKMWGLQENALKIYRNKGWHWADEDGDILKWVQNRDAFQAFLREYSEMGTSRRNAHVVIEDITEG